MLLLAAPFIVVVLHALVSISIARYNLVLLPVLGAEHTISVIYADNGEAALAEVHARGSYPESALVRRS